MVHRYVAAHRTILRTDDRAVFNNDHIICWKDVGQPLDCNYEQVILETRATPPEWTLADVGLHIGGYPGLVVSESVQGKGRANAALMPNSR